LAIVGRAAAVAPGLAASTPGPRLGDLEKPEVLTSQWVLVSLQYRSPYFIGARSGEPPATKVWACVARAKGQMTWAVAAYRRLFSGCCGQSVWVREIRSSVFLERFNVDHEQVR
jgi:hypothetical protein